MAFGVSSPLKPTLPSARIASRQKGLFSGALKCEFLGNKMLHTLKIQSQRIKCKYNNTFKIARKEEILRRSERVKYRL